MRTLETKNKNKNKFAILANLLLCALLFAGCKEDIDSSAFYTFTGQTVTDMLANEPELSAYYELTKVTRPTKVSESMVSELLSTRGNYTCFAPTNQAISEYLTELHNDGIIENPVTSVLDITPENVRDSICQVIVLNSVIDGGSTVAYQTSDFPNSGSLPLPNMNNRALQAKVSTDDGQTSYYVNTTSRIINADNEVENGYVQIVDKVVAPNNINLSKLLKLNENMQVFGDFLEQSGLAEQISVNYQDDEYEDGYLFGTVDKDIPAISTESADRPKTPEHRYIGFTAFVETDDVLARYGISDIPSLLSYLESHNLYSTYKGQPSDYSNDPAKFKNPNHALHQFVAYHLLPMAIAYNDLVHHYNELDYDKKNKQITLPVFEYYYTMNNPRRLIKVTQSKTSNGIRLNRHKDHDPDSFDEITPTDPSQDIEGILVGENLEGDLGNDALNGYLYPIDDLLVYDDRVARIVLNERLRFDLASILPEMMTNKMRRLDTEFPDGRNKGFPTQIQYFENIRYSKDTQFYYLPGVNSGWADYQGDEFMATGLYDFYLKLPPVPFSGNYEIRYGIQANDQRGMAQVYFGEVDKEISRDELPTGLIAEGIPLDLRKGGVKRWQYQNKSFPSNVGWEEDTDDEDYNADVDKRMRNNGYLKGPNYFCVQGSTSKGARTDERVVRRIVATKKLDENKTYWLRFKSVMDVNYVQFMFDYLEIVPQEIYANPSNPEDKW